MSYLGKGMRLEQRINLYEEIKTRFVLMRKDYPHDSDHRICERVAERMHCSPWTVYHHARRAGLTGQRKLKGQ